MTQNTAVELVPQNKKQYSVEIYDQGEFVLTDTVWVRWARAQDFQAEVSRIWTSEEFKGFHREGLGCFSAIGKDDVTGTEGYHYYFTPC